jgi:hypothetical protein
LTIYPVTPSFQSLLDEISLEFIFNILLPAGRKVHRSLFLENFEIKSHDIQLQDIPYNFNSDYQSVVHLEYQQWNIAKIASPKYVFTIVVDGNQAHILKTLIKIQTIGIVFCIV